MGNFVNNWSHIDTKMMRNCGTQKCKKDKSSSSKRCTVGNTAHINPVRYPKKCSACRDNVQKLRVNTLVKLTPTIFNFYGQNLYYSIVTSDQIIRSVGTTAHYFILAVVLDSLLEYGTHPTQDDLKMTLRC